MPRLSLMSLRFALQCNVVLYFIALQVTEFSSFSVSLKFCFSSFMHVNATTRKCIKFSSATWTVRKFYSKIRRELWTLSWRVFLIGCSSLRLLQNLCFIFVRASMSPECHFSFHKMFRLQWQLLNLAEPYADLQHHVLCYYNLSEV